MNLRARSIAFLLIAGCSTAWAAPSVPTSPPDQVHPGQKAVVRTVFEGSRVESFDAEIVGVLPGGRAEGDMIVARATSERVIKSGIAQGMSGSPVYVDGKLIGALSSGWSFSRDPLFGITPIGEMLSVLDLPVDGARDGSAGPAGVEVGVRGASTRFGEWTWADEPDEGLPPAQSSRPDVPSHLAIPLTCGGLHPGALSAARDLFAPLGLEAVQGGRAVAGSSPAIEPGSAVAVDLLRGDLHISAIGTVTYRDGDRVLIFGHPLFQSGEVRLPLSTASITTIVASQLSSFKLGAPGTPVGTLTQDRRAAMGGALGESPALLPYAVDIDRPRRPRQSFRFETIEDRALAPQLMSIAALNCMLESGGSGGNQTVRWTMRLKRAGAPALTLSDVLTSDSPSGDLVSAVASPLRFLFGNPFARLELDSVALRLDVAPGRESWTLRNAEVMSAAARPGQSVEVRYEIERWRGGRESGTLRVAIPEEVPDGRYSIWLGGGAELSRFEAQRLPGRYRPASLDEAWQRLDQFRPSDGLYATLVARAPEVTTAGRDYPELPTSALTLMAGGQRAGDRARRGDRLLIDQRRHPVAGVLRGELQLEVNVDSKAP